MIDAVSREQRYCITGGGGFLGSFVVERLIAAGVPPTQITVPRRATCDLTRAEACERLFADLQPEVVIHLAAEVGGIGCLVVLGFFVLVAINILAAIFS